MFLLRWRIWFCLVRLSPPSIIHIQQVTELDSPSLYESAFSSSPWFFNKMKYFKLYIKTALISTLASLSRKFYHFFFFSQSDTEFGRMSWGIGANFLVSLLRDYGNKKLNIVENRIMVQNKQTKKVTFQQ